MGKHAYLIMAHSDWDTLNTLLELIDDIRNDIYIHIDKKSTFDLQNIYSTKYSKCYYIKRKNVSWGGDTQIRCELDLLKSALNDKYDYYHLLSGVDLPIKTQDEIHDFFDLNNGKNYIDLDSDAMKNNNFINRCSQYHFLQNKIGKNKGKIIALYSLLEKNCISLQKMLGINRIKNIPMKLYKGAQWFSITHEMAKIILSNEKIIKKYFNKGIAVDELFLQTIAYNSSLRYTIVNENLRYIDWNRGNPYVFRLSDYEELINSKKKLFARKFSSDVDKEIIEKIKLYLKYQ